MSPASPRSVLTRSSAGFELRPLLDREMQVKRLLRDQKIIAGVGNAYSDEILHAAKLSPFAIAESLGEEEIVRLETALQRRTRRGCGGGPRQARC